MSCTLCFKCQYKRQCNVAILAEHIGIDCDSFTPLLIEFREQQTA